MTSWLAEQLPLLTLILGLMLASHQWLLKKLGAKSIYQLWLIIPVALVTHNLPILSPKAAQILPEVTTYIVNSKQQINAFSQFEWVTLFWLTGAFITLLVALLAHRHINSQFSANMALTQNEKSELNLPGHLPSYWGVDISSPILVGLRKQKLLLPNNFTHQYSKEQQQLILAHEICHFNRNDIYWNLMAFIGVSLFWFHPLVWLAYFRFRRDQELSCDHHVLARKQKDSRVNYGKALVKTAQSQARSAFAFSHISFRQYGDKHIMIERINQLKNTQQGASTATLLIIIAITALLSMFSVAGVHHDDVKITHAKKGETIKPVLRYEPDYPSAAASDNVEGSVILKFDISPQGKVDNISIIKSKPEGVFDQSAAKALAKWQYQTSAQGAKDVLVQLDFLLGNNDKSALLETERISVSNH